ncbi:hypothetical protein MGN01_29950 [Methylobacterium gnaphalii]|uniref:Uncharacterized protein n=1 Tax=Methylobacterium gnaphalii TaxID=1010610 RepID=A0A512JMF0_9HYPH|nr:hypothetical protein MGN01_29950 [Methylobacterium gnaphalii]GLS49655.1 hypothetical protein GCM10007885_25050 [Methylobacterium gnaphalii]
MPFDQGRVAGGWSGAATVPAGDGGTGSPTPRGAGMASPLRIASRSLRAPAIPSVPPGAVAGSLPAGAPVDWAKAGKVEAIIPHASIAADIILRMIKNLP